MKPKNYANFEYQRIWNQHKILRFFDTHFDILEEKIFWVIIALFVYSKCKCEKNCTFSNILQNVKSYFFGNIYQSPFDSYWYSQKSIKLKPPIAQPLSQFPHSCVREQFIYSHDRSAYSVVGKYVDRSWEYKNRSQAHECGNWNLDLAIPFLGILYIIGIFVAVVDCGWKEHFAFASPNFLAKSCWRK